MQGRFSLGAVLMFQGFLGSFMSPAMTLVSAGQTIQEMRTQMDRVEDVMEYPEDENVAGHAPEAEAAGFSKLRGNVELKNVTFGYSRLEEPLIKDFSLTSEQVSAWLWSAGQAAANPPSYGCFWDLRSPKKEPSSTMGRTSKVSTFPPSGGRSGP